MRLACVVALVGWRILAPDLTHSQTAPRKRALLITIGAYPATSGYPRIHTSYDADLVRAALVAQGFDSTSIRVLRDSVATREGILSALEQLTADAGPGDALVIHYSGHGHRITDDNGDEIDGYDELLVPFGAPAQVRASSYHGERHIRDDELGPILERLRQRVGATGSVIVLLDACFSGSATRGSPDEPAVRGVAEPIQVLAGRRAPVRGRAGVAGGGILDAGESRGESGAVSGLAPMVVVSASAHDQLAHETYDDTHRVVGSLSLAVSRVLGKLPAGSTYRVLFERLAGAMASMNLGDQQPQIEGQVDAQVFGGQIVAQHAFLRVEQVREDSLVDLPGGTILGLLPGTRVAFHPSGTVDPRAQPPLAVGVVRQASTDGAVVALGERTPGRDLHGTWAFVTEYAYGDQRVHVALDRTLSPAQAAKIRAHLGQMAVVLEDDHQPDLRIGRAQGPDTRLVLRTLPGGQIIGLPLELGRADFGTRLEAAIQTFARVNYLRRLDLDAPALAVRMELILTERRIVWSGAAPACSAVPPRPRAQAERGTRLVLAPRDEYTLRFTNEGRDSAYVVVLDLTPDGRVEQLYPLPDALGNDNVLAPGGSFLVSGVCFFAEQASGTEMLKLFATQERLDFATLVSGTRGDSPGAASTRSITFTVAPRAAARRRQN